MTEENSFPKAKKNLGQNFLTDESYASLVVKELEIEKGDTLIEVGPGTGALTKHFQKVSGDINFNYIGLEFDRDLIESLQTDFPQKETFRILNANVLNYLEIKAPITNFKLAGNLPYNITSPLLHRICFLKNKPEKCVFMVQKEVAEKICETDKKSSYLSTFVNTFFETKYLTAVPKEVFHPQPKVDGGIISLQKRALVRIENPQEYEKFLHHIYSNPRKMLNKVYPKEFLLKHGLEASKRPQEYNWETYLKIYDKHNSNR